MAALKSAKSALRKEMKQRLAALSEDQKQKQSKAVCEKVTSSSWFQSCRRICVFLSMSDEVDTLPLLTASLAAGKECFVPHYKGPHMSMVPLASMEHYHRLPRTKWNIKQPADEDVGQDAMETGGLDVIFMPGLAFTAQGARLGRGKGYYDTYLERCQQKTGVLPRTVALIFSQQLVDFVPVGAQDVLVQQVVSVSPEDLQ